MQIRPHLTRVLIFRKKNHLRKKFIWKSQINSLDIHFPLRPRPHPPKNRICLGRAVKEKNQSPRRSSYFYWYGISGFPEERSGNEPASTCDRLRGNARPRARVSVEAWATNDTGACRRDRLGTPLYSTTSDQPETRRHLFGFFGHFKIFLKIIFFFLEHKKSIYSSL